MDNILFEKSMEESTSESSPFSRREMVKIKDMNTAGNYSSNTSSFETVTLSNGGKWCDYTEGYITLPVVTVISAPGVDWTVGSVKDTDYLLALKNSNLNLINSCQIDYGNRSVVQSTDHINSYLIFKQHTEMSEQDQKLHGPTIGYHKDNSKSWYYDNVNGVCNNGCAPLASLVPTRLTEINIGFLNRCKTTHSLSDNLRGVHSIFGDATSSNIKQSNRSYIVNATTHKAYYYNVIIRLKDLPLFRSFPALLKGGNFKINLTLNQCEFSFSTGASLGNMEFQPNTFNGKMTNPVMVSSAVVKIIGTDSGGATIDEIVPSGSALLPLSKAYTVSVNIARPQFATHQQLNVAFHQEQNCELHVPVYDLKPAFESRYLAQDQKRITYNEVLLTVLSNKTAGSTFNDLITNGIKHLRRLIIMPTIASSGNGTGTVNPRLSCFDSCPSTCSPYILENFQVQVANQNIYSNAINYSYDMFLQEMNGKYGLESSIFPGVSSSMISLQDYIENYGYIVVDLKRKYTEDDSTPLSIQISGRLKSLKNMDFYCFIETEKTMTISLATGQRLD